MKQQVRATPDLIDSVKAFAAFLHRCKGLYDDGYALSFKHEGESLWYYRFHHANGNIIELKLYTKELKLVQLTNGRKVHSSTLREY